MKMKTGLLALGLLTFAGTTIVNCGGSSDESSSTGTAGKGGTNSTAGSSSTAGNASTAGTSSTGGNTGTAGSSASTAGTASTGGNAATGGNSGTAGNNNNQGGAPDIGAGGAGTNPPGCPAAMPAEGTMCMQVQGACDYGDMSCRCRRANGGGNMRTWQCDPAIGAGGAPGGFGQATCPANAQDGDACTGQGLCAGQQCFCAQGMTNCFG